LEFFFYLPEYGLYTLNYIKFIYGYNGEILLKELYFRKYSFLPKFIIMINKKFLILILVKLSVFLFLVSGQVFALSLPDADTMFRNGKLFPSVYFTDTISMLRRAETSRPYWVNTSEEIKKIKQMSANQVSLLLNNDILAYYGHPNSRNMGILGRYSIEDLDKLLSELVVEYENISGGRGIVKAFYLIYGTVWPGAEIGILGHDTLMRYIEYGMKNDVLVFIDHQIGRYDPIDSLKRMLPYLHYPNVHLALDPEWRTLKPMVEIGHLTADEINIAQQVMEDYLIENDLPGERMLVIHQFNYLMIRNRSAVKTDFNRLRLIHCMDGIGSPSMKRDSYAFNGQATNIPVKGFKLFYNLGIPGAGFDNPLMTPKQVYDLNPRPYVIMYQ
jgi:hypothetical protein